MPDELSGRELSEAVAERVFDEPMPPVPTECTIDVLSSEPSPKGVWQHVHIYDHGDVCEWEPLNFAESIEAAYQVEDRIAELGKQGDYIAALWDVIGSDRSVNFWTASNTRAFWLCVHATPEQRSRAALACMNGSKT